MFSLCRKGIRSVIVNNIYKKTVKRSVVARYASLWTNGKCQTCRWSTNRGNRETLSTQGNSALNRDSSPSWVCPRDHCPRKTAGTPCSARLKALLYSSSASHSCRCSGTTGRRASRNSCNDRNPCCSPRVKLYKLARKFLLLSYRLRYPCKKQQFKYKKTVPIFSFPHLFK